MPKIDWKFLGLILGTMILAVWLGFILGRITYQNSRGVINIAPADKNTGLYDSQTATVTAKILEVNGNKLLVQKDDGLKGELELARRFTIRKIISGESVATVSSNIQYIETQKNALISLSKFNNSFSITSISYIPTISSETKESSLSSQAK